MLSYVAVHGALIFRLIEQRRVNVSVTQLFAGGFIILAIG